MGSSKNILIFFPLVVHCLVFVAMAENPPSDQNSSLLLLSNCSARFPPGSGLTQDCAVFRISDDEAQYSCLFVDDSKNHGIGLDMRKALDCSSYRWVYRNSVDENGSETRMSFDIPGHVPSLCDLCKKPDGRCGVELRCICHPKECSE